MPEDIVVKLTADLFKTLSHPVRIKILHILQDTEHCVCEIIEAVEIEQSNLSQHLSLMKKQGVIVSRKEGAKVFYKIAYKEVLMLLNSAEKLIAEQVKMSQGILKYFDKH